MSKQHTIEPAFEVSQVFPQRLQDLFQNPEGIKKQLTKHRSIFINLSVIYLSIINSFMCLLFVSFHYFFK